MFKKILLAVSLTAVTGSAIASTTPPPEGDFSVGYTHVGSLEGIDYRLKLEVNDNVYLKFGGSDLEKNGSMIEIRAGYLYHINQDLRFVVEGGYLDLKNKKNPDGNQSLAGKLGLEFDKFDEKVQFDIGVEAASFEDNGAEIDLYAGAGYKLTDRITLSAQYRGFVNQGVISASWSF